MHRCYRYVGYKSNQIIKSPYTLLATSHHRPTYAPMHTRTHAHIQMHTHTYVYTHRHNYSPAENYMPCAKTFGKHKCCNPELQSYIILREASWEY